MEIKILRRVLDGRRSQHGRAPDALVDFHTGSDATMGLRLNFLDGIHLRGSPKFMTGVPLGSTTLSRPFASCLLWRSWAFLSTLSRKSFSRKSFSSFESGFGPTSVGGNSTARPAATFSAKVSSDKAWRYILIVCASIESASTRAMFSLFSSGFMACSTESPSLELFVGVDDATE